MGDSIMASTINAKNTSTGVVITPDASGQLELQTADTTRMTITSSGNVGIGITSPSYKLDVAGQIASQDAYLITANSSGTPSAGAFIFRPASNTIALGTASTERMRIDSNGSLLVGTSTSGSGQQHFISASNVIGQQVLTVTKSNQVSQIAGNYYMQFNGSNGADGYIQTNGSSVLTIVDASDIRLKEDIIDATYGLSTVQALRPVEFKWKDNQNSTIVKGFIAQEVKEVLPECVSIKDESNNNGFSDMHYLETQTMIPVLVKAIQELKAELDTVKAELATLKGTA